MKTVISTAVAMLLAATSLCADQQGQSSGQTQRPKPMQSQKAMQPFEQGLDLSVDKFPAAYNAPARVDVRDCWDFFLTGSFIYWYVGQQGMELAVEGVRGLGNHYLPTSGTHVKHSKQSYHPGFKVGLGLNFDEDNWVGYAEYTWMHETTKTSLGQLVGASSWILSDWFGNYAGSMEAKSAASSWKCHFDLLDLSVSRPFYQGRKVTVLPYGGLRGFSLRQFYSISANSVTMGTSSLESTFSHNKQKSWAIGFLSGMKTNWLLGAGFRMEGDLGMSLLYNKFTKVSVNQKNSYSADGGRFHVREKASTVRSTLDMAAGLGWGSYLAGQCYYLDIYVAYEFFLLPGQNMMRYLSAQTFDSASGAPNDLFMHGLTVQARFDF